MLELYEQLEAPSDQELIALKEMHLDLDSHVLESLGCDGDMAADVRRPENREAILDRILELNFERVRGGV